MSVDNANGAQSVPIGTGTSVKVVDPVPMSFPQILRNSKLADRFAYLQDEAPRTHTRSVPSVLSKKTREDREGKRWTRRKENSQFAGNPHIAPVSRADMSIQPPIARRTFPEPLPRYLPRSLSAPSPQPPAFDAHSANAGRYSMSLKGIRRSLRQHGPRTQLLVRDIEREIIEWLVGGTIIAPDDESELLLGVPGRPIGDGTTIKELSRTPLQLVWAIEQDSFARYIIHCCARYHAVVSFSKDVDGRRLTYLLRPNVTRPDYTARAALDTPPATELSDYSLSVLSETDILSVEENEPIPSDAISDNETPNTRLASVSEKESESEYEAADVTPRPPRASVRNDPRHSRGGTGNDADDDQSVDGDDLVQSVQSLDLDLDLDNALALLEPPIRYTGLQTERTPLRDRRGVSRTESSPSPSRSPYSTTRRTARHIRPRLTGRRPVKRTTQSFYDYLYS